MKWLRGACARPAFDALPCARAGRVLRAPCQQSKRTRRRRVAIALPRFRCSSASRTRNRFAAIVVVSRVRRCPGSPANA